MTDLYVGHLENQNTTLRHEIARLTSRLDQALAQVQAAQAAVTPHNEEWGWQCSCCAAVAKALGAGDE